MSETKEMNIKFQGWHKVYLCGSLLTGDTFPVRNWIKNHLNGKWIASSQGWEVDLELVKKYSNESGTTLMAK